MFNELGLIQKVMKQAFHIVNVGNPWRSVGRIINSMREHKSISSGSRESTTGHARAQ